MHCASSPSVTIQMHGCQVHQAGFSLVELIIAICLMSILLAIAAPEVNIWMQNNRIRTISENYLAGLQMARAEAIKSNASASIQMREKGAWEITDAAAAVLQTRAAGDGEQKVVTTITLPAGSTLPFTVTFSGLGRVTVPASSMQIDFTSPDIGNCIAAGGSVRCLRINLQVGGSTRLCDPARPVGDFQAC